MNPRTRGARWCAARLGSLAALIAAGLLLPSAAMAITTEADWSITTQLTDGEDGSERSVVINVGECRDMVESDDDIALTFSLDDTASLDVDAEYAVKVRQGNEACDLTSLDSEASDDCKTEISRSGVTASDPPIELTLDLGDVLTVSDPGGCEELNTTTSISLIIEDFDLDLEPDIYDVTFDIRFDTRRPTAPTNVSAEAGEESVEVNWDDPGTGVEDYRIRATTTSIATGDFPEDIGGETADVSDTNGQIRGLTVDTTYNITVTAIDDFGNESLVGEVVTVTTQPVDDFWERYSDENDVDGGFCFIATAAWGSYQAPHVQVLRDFRDRYLLTNAPGRLFVDTYYATSPPLADFIAGSDTLRAVTRVALLPLYAFALAMNYTGPIGKLALLVAFALFMHLLWRLWPGGWYAHRARRPRAQSSSSRRLARGNRGRLHAPLRVLSILFVGLLALALGYGEARAESPVDMVFEGKAGPYTPDGLGDTYTQFFGDDSAIMFEFELDWQFYRGIGSLGVGGSFGYGSVDGKAQTAAGEDSVDDTALNWMPFRAMLVYRFDWLWLRHGIPLTVYAKGGLDYYVWWITDGSDDVSINDEGQEGSGGTFGWHGTGGIAFVLDWLAQDMAFNFDVEWGVNNSYLFFEYIYSQIDNFGSSGVNLTDEGGTFQIGLALEF